MLDQTAAAPTDPQQPRQPAASTIGMRLRVDAAPATFGATPIEVSPEGYKVYRGVAAFGDVVLEYPEFGRNEFVPAGEALAPEALVTLVGVPFTIHHPDDLLSADDPDEIKDHVEGTVLRAEADMSKSPPELVVDVKVWTATAQEAIESGRVRDLSPGYQCESDDAPTGAIRGGKPYSLIQRGRRYNHLSGVLTARGVTPDGRRARLDEAASPAAYARGVEEDIVVTPAMDPAEALAAFSPEAQEILKTLPPEDLAVLSELALTAKGEAAEEAVIAAGAESVEEVEDASAAGREREAIGEDLKEAAEKAEGDVGKDAGALNMDTVKQMIADAIAGLSAPAARSDASPAAPTTVDAAAERKRIEAEVRAEHEFITTIRRRGGRCDSVADATKHALGVVKATDPALLPIAEDAAKTGRRDHLLALFNAADNRRRDAYIGEAEAALFAVSEADDEYHRSRARNDGAGLGDGAGTDMPAYLDYGPTVTTGSADPSA